MFYSIKVEYSKNFINYLKVYRYNLFRLLLKKKKKKKSLSRKSVYKKIWLSLVRVFFYCFKIKKGNAVKLHFIFSVFPYEIGKAINKRSHNSFLNPLFSWIKSQNIKKYKKSFDLLYVILYNTYSFFIET